MATEVARRISFGSSKQQEVSFPMHRYLECLERWSNETPSFITMQQNYKSLNWESELAKLKEYFSKLKFNYIEYETKRVFLESLKKPKDEILPTKEVNAELDMKIEDGKREVAGLKAKIEKTTKDIEATLKDLNAEFVKFEEERNALITELEGIKKTIDEKPDCAAPLQLITQRDEVDQMCRAMTEIGGAELIESSKDHMLLRLTQLSPTEKVPDYTLCIHVDPKTKQMGEVELTPGGVYYADIAEEAVRSADVRFLIRELQCRIVNYHLIQAEIAELKRVFGTQMRLDNNLFTILVKEKIAAQMSIGTDYPHPHSRVTLVKMENTPKPIVDALKLQINKAANWQSLTSVVQSISSAVALL